MTDYQVDETPNTVPSYCPYCGSEELKLQLSCPRCELELWRCKGCNRPFSVDVPT